MNILIVSAVYNPEPVVSAKLSEDIANYLSVNHDVVVLAPKPTGLSGLVTLDAR